MPVAMQTTPHFDCAAYAFSSVCSGSGWIHNSFSTFEHQLLCKVCNHLAFQKSTNYCRFYFCQNSGKYGSNTFCQITKPTGNSMTCRPLVCHHIGNERLCVTGFNSCYPRMQILEKPSMPVQPLLQQLLWNSRRPTVQYCTRICRPMSADICAPLKHKHAGTYEPNPKQTNQNHMSKLLKHTTHLCCIRWMHLATVAR